MGSSLPAEAPDGQLILDLDGFGGPLDLLLQLARDRKIDLTQLSIATLAEQYIAFIEQARHLQLEVAADYLVMAAWLAYLKSRLLLPASPDNDGETEQTPLELAAALAFQLRRLEAMRDAGDALMVRPRLGSSVLSRGARESFSTKLIGSVDLSMHDFLEAYAKARARSEPVSLYQIAPLMLDSIEHALERLSGVLSCLPHWSALSGFIPADVPSPLHRRAHLAATFGAGLELVKRGTLTIKQERPFAALYVRGIPQPEVFGERDG